MGKIYEIMGRSSCGKDTIYKKLLERGNANLNKVIIYTTRPMREGEVDGVERVGESAKKRDDLLSPA